MENGAGLKRRFGALLFDYLMIVAWGFLLLAIGMFLYFVVLDGVPTFGELGMNLISLTMILPVLLCSIIMEAGVKHATFGKQKMKTKVAAINSNTIKLWQVAVRNVIKFLPWQLAHMTIFRGFALNWELPPMGMLMLVIADMLPMVWIAVIVFRKDHRGIHDFIAKTVVIDANEL